MATESHSNARQEDILRSGFPRSSWGSGTSWSGSRSASRDCTICLLARWCGGHNEFGERRGSLRLSSASLPERGQAPSLHEQVVLAPPSASPRVTLASDGSSVFTSAPLVRLGRDSDDCNGCRDVFLRALAGAQGRT